MASRKGLGEKGGGGGTWRGAGRGGRPPPRQTLSAALRRGRRPTPQSERGRRIGASRHCRCLRQARPAVWRISTAPTLAACVGDNSDDPADSEPTAWLNPGFHLTQKKRISFRVSNARAKKSGHRAGQEGSEKISWRERLMWALPHTTAPALPRQGRVAGLRCDCFKPSCCRILFSRRAVHKAPDPRTMARLAQDRRDTATAMATLPVIRADFRSSHRARPITLARPNVLNRQGGCQFRQKQDGHIPSRSRSHCIPTCRQSRSPRRRFAAAAQLHCWLLPDICSIQAPSMSIKRGVLYLAGV